jgi:hypothetical protein
LSLYVKFLNWLKCPKEVQKRNVFMYLEKWLPNSTIVSIFGEKFSVADSLYIQ